MANKFERRSADARRAITATVTLERFWLWLGLCSLLLGACAASTSVTGSSVVPATVEPSPGESDVAPTPSPSPTPTVAPIEVPAEQLANTADLDLGFEPSRIGGLVTSTGIPVAVLGEVEGRMLVRTPCGAVAFVSGAEPLTDIEVVLDPGHGGPVDTGAVGPNGLVEADLDLRLGRATLAELARRGVGVALTRDGDYLSTLEVRSAFADTLGARLMISIHHNAPNALPSDTPGTEVFVQSGSADSRRLGGLVQEYVTEALSSFGDVVWTTAPDAGVLRVLNSEGGDAYGMIRRPVTPTALVELGYISNAQEAELFTSAQYISVAARSLADAAEAFLSSSEPGSGFVAEPRVFDPARAPGAEVCTDPPLE